MSVSRSTDSSHPLPLPGGSALRQDVSETASYSLFGVRIDAFTPALAARLIFEGAVEGRALRVVLADLWTLLLAQRDFSVWESLSAADYVLPAGDDPVVRRLTGRHHIPPIWPDQLLNDLLLALEQHERSVVLMAPADEIGADMELVHRLWPRLRVTDVSMERLTESKTESKSVASVEHERLARAVNAGQPDVFVVGGNSPWQERWTFEQRANLRAGATLVLPALQPALAAIAQRSGLKVPAPAWMRRRVAFQRAFAATLAPTAAASARVLNDLLRGPRQSPLGRWHLTPASLQRLSLLREARKSQVPVRVAEWRGSDESAIRRLTESPLARLGPPRGGPPLPALPAPAENREAADQPTMIFTREELRALLPDVVTGHIVELPEATRGAGAGQPADAVIALGPKAGTAPAPGGPADPYETSPLPPDEQPPQAAQSAPPERVAATPPLAPTTMLPGRPRRPKVNFAARAEPAPPAESKPASPPPAPAGALSPTSPIASPALRLEELNTLKAHLHARRRLLRRRRKLQSQRRHRDPE
ncbi:MAG TPA: WecB/TagA/CpsF family glycosyltransferase [Ktedonobacterales bacterium]|jgi:UDP-N-acetyl-D-mannosaminuronic acid transferase (WecB/TagA/CpsF family)